MSESNDPLPKPTHLDARTKIEEEIEEYKRYIEAATQRIQELEKEVGENKRDSIYGEKMGIEILKRHITDATRRLEALGKRTLN